MLLPFPFYLFSASNHCVLVRICMHVYLQCICITTYIKVLQFFDDLSIFLFRFDENLYRIVLYISINRKVGR